MVDLVGLFQKVSRKQGKHTREQTVIILYMTLRISIQVSIDVPLMCLFIFVCTKGELLKGLR